jgi:uncharacterized membrane protein YkvA (DUF1232 family)
MLRQFPGGAMPIQVTFEISDDDLEYFRGVFQKAKENARDKKEGDILAAARRQARQMRQHTLPQFVVDRIQSLDVLTRMLEDEDWKLQSADRSRVIQALAYFAEPADLIPDQIPGLGFLDDAIMVELVVAELRPELDSYLDFCRFRDEQRGQAGADPKEERKRLEARRHEIYARIERRRDQRERRGGIFSLFS